MFYHAFFVSFMLSAVLTYAYIYYAHHKNWLDIPNQRSSHSVTTPRGGGIVFVSIWLVIAAAAVFYSVWTVKQVLILLPGALIVAVVGFCDDRKSLSARYRAFGYFIAALISVYLIGNFNQLLVGQTLVLPLPWIGSILAILAIVWSTNLFNFMDGTDGIAAMEAIFILGIGGFFFWNVHAEGMAMITWVLGTSVAGFLVWNKPPAKLFMGDVGSATLGFVIMVLALYGEKQYGVPALLWIIVYAAFIFDATITLLRRLIAREPVYLAHRSHAYQRLHQSGWSHMQVLCAYGCVNVILAGVGVFAFYNRGWLIGLLLVVILILTCLYIIVERRSPMYPQSNKMKLID